MSKKIKEAWKRNRDFIKLMILILGMLGLSLLAIYLMPWIISLKDETIREELITYMHSKGVWGILMLLGVQILQVILAIIPGEPIEVLAGLLYGTFYGYLICTIGMIIGTVIIFYSMRALGASFINSMIGEEKLLKYKFLQNSKKLEVITFILFFIPGTPKDLLTYFMPFTKIKPMTFFVLVTIARIPSIISSTFAGASIGEGKWIQTIVIFCVIGLVGILGIVFNDKLVKHFQHKRQAIKSKLHKRK